MLTGLKLKIHPVMLEKYLSFEKENTNIPVRKLKKKKPKHQNKTLSFKYSAALKNNNKKQKFDSFQLTILWYIELLSICIY